MICHSTSFGDSLPDMYGVNSMENYIYGKQMTEGMKDYDSDRYYIDCEKEEREQRELEMAESRRFVEGMMKYPEKGIPVYIDDKIPEEQRDWDKLMMIREDDQFYMADFVEDQEHGGLKEIRWNKVYHGELESETAKRKRGRRRK